MIVREMFRSRVRQRTLSLLMIITMGVLILVQTPWTRFAPNTAAAQDVQQQAAPLPPIGIMPIGQTLNQLFRRR